MLLLLWLALGLAAASLLLLPLALWFLELYKRYSGSRAVACPENHEAAAVNLDAAHAAATGIDGLPELRLCDCTRWPEHMNCDRACLPQAEKAGAYTPDTYRYGKGTRRSKQIYHLPIVLAAFAAWCLGVFWHSQYLFRARWMNAAGLTQAEVKEMVRWYSPHLLSAAICLLFAYGVAWLLAVSHRMGVLQGMMMAVLLCAAVIGAGAYGISRLPAGLLAIEAGYAILATLAIGAIVGGFCNKLVLPHSERR